MWRKSEHGRHFTQKPKTASTREKLFISGQTCVMKVTVLNTDQNSAASAEQQVCSDAMQL